MPCILKVRISRARNLPIMDRATELTGKLGSNTDAFVEVKFADLDASRTAISRKTLNPVWNEDFRFEVIEDSDLQNEPLEIKIFDYDQITYNESIGTVLIDLNPLLAWDSPGQVSGWFPIYDTLHGIRGELNAQAKIQFFGNINPFKDSSAGVQFFSTPAVPAGYQIASVLGFVNAIQTEDDPEYHWVDSFRTPRKSNEARTKVMFRLSGGRMLGKKVLDLGGNAVLGFKQYFDLEEEKKTIAVRSIGTAVKLVQSSSVQKLIHQLSAYSPAIGNISPAIAPTSPEKSVTEAGTQKEEIDDISLPSPINPNTSHGIMRPQDPVFLTLNQFPAKCIINTGGFVCAASIKVLDNDERDVREAWWAEVRDEIKSHARTVGCAFVVGYSETTSISEEVALLYCSGTAVNIDISLLQMLSQKSIDDLPNTKIPVSPRWGSVNNIDEVVSGSRRDLASIANSNSKSQLDPSKAMHEDPENYNSGKKKKSKALDCRSCHISYNRHESPFPMALTRCGGCKKKFVPEILLTTTEPPPELKLIGTNVLIEAHVCRPKKIKIGESRATMVSESIPFAQYDIHRQLMYKLRIYSMNAVFGLKVQISVGEDLMTAVATGTAVYVRSLPSPPALKVFRTLDVIDDEDKLLLETQRRLMEKSEINRQKIEAVFKLEAEKEILPEGFEEQMSNSDSSDSSEEEDMITSSLGAPQSRLQQRAMVVEIDDEQDEDLVLFLDDVWNENFQMCNIETPVEAEPMTHSQMIKMVKQSSIDVSHHPNRQLAMIFKSMYQELAQQVSFFSPCSITGLAYSVDIPKDTIVQVYLTAMVHGKLVSGDLEILNFDGDRLESGTDLLEVDNTRFPAIMGRVSQTNIPSSAVTAGTPASFAPIADTPSNYQFDDEDSGNDDDLLSDDGEQESIRRRPSEPNAESTFRLSAVAKDIYLEQIELSQLSYIPRATHKRFLGRICHHFIKEANLAFDSSMGNSGMGGFSHVFMVEIISVIRSHVQCLGGNAVVAFNVDQIHFTESLKNQGYALVSASGDVWQVTYPQKAPENNENLNIQS